ncbi:glycosyltransferase family 2 protein [Cellulosimicrobium cellulans]|uniref:glycosyltransferase family 2 protein n=1 Tax=Cellulosimicrobium cellulans TaxID=1710 RepID=UPI0018833B09|nr:glycosyltransferase [Cellulosimicrobium cellulans]MBE9937984.1 glycosyltransferase [Cellulosimicrobium cellulans]
MTSDARGELRVTVAVPTFRRPRELAGLLRAVAPHLETLSEDLGIATVGEVLVVDNDPARSAERVVAAAAGTVRYVHEPLPGISAARDTALRRSADSDLLVFIDDDELPRARWLAELLAVWLERRPAAVAGRVVAEFDAEPDEWIRAGRFFERRYLPRGTSVRAAAAGNLLLDIEQVHRSGVTFDRRLGMGGGEDTLFTSALTRRGFRIEWAPDSVIVDRVPADRLRKAWVLRRRFAHGTVVSTVAVRLATSGRERALARVAGVARGLALVGSGALRWLRGLVTGSLARRARATADVWRGAGRIAGAAGLHFPEYRRAGRSRLSPQGTP